jgi:hypothetical protein
MYLFQFILRYGFQVLDSTTDYKNAKDDRTTYGEKFFYHIFHIFLTTTTTAQMYGGPSKPEAHTMGL